MRNIPLGALVLGLAGLIPFVWGAATQYFPALAAASGLNPVWLGSYLSLTYGTVILSFMSGVLWGFATRAEGAQATAGYALSVIPALWAFFMVNGDPGAAAVNLAAGFAGVLVLDGAFVSWRLAPAWWLALRIPLTVVVLACLAVPILM